MQRVFFIASFRLFAKIVGLAAIVPLSDIAFHPMDDPSSRW